MLLLDEVLLVLVEFVFGEFIGKFLRLALARAELRVGVAHLRLLVVGVLTLNFEFTLEVGDLQTTHCTVTRIVSVT